MEQAASEFGINPRTLTNRLKTNGIIPNEKDKRYSTQQICKAVFGDIDVERLRKLTEEADKLALDNEKTRGGLVEIEAVYKHFQGLFVALRSRLLASSLTDEEKDELLGDLRKLKAGDFSKSMRVGEDTEPAAGDSDSTAAVEREPVVG